MINLPLTLNPACIKTLSAVEASPAHSNQHEFNGVVALKKIFGIANFSTQAQFSILGQPISETAKVTWYDSRAANTLRTEHRLYFQSNIVMASATAGDNVIIGYDVKKTLHIILIKQGSGGLSSNITQWETIETQTT